MIQKYVFGTPFPTDAVTVEIEPTKEKMPFLQTDGKGTFT